MALDMDLHHIEYFLELARHEHVALTADVLNISQSALSKSISTLETELGVKLFDRVGRRIKLNKNGKAFVQYAEQAMKLLSMGQMSAKSMCYESNGYISIHCFAYAPIIIPCVSAYSELNPYTTFSISQWQSSRGQEGQDLPDFILRSSQDPYFLQKRNQFWVPQPLFQEKYCLVSSDLYQPLNWQQCGESIDLAELKNAFFITMTQKDNFFNDVTDEFCQAAGFLPRTYARTDDFVIKMKMVGQGRGVALIPEACLEDAEGLVSGLRHFSLKNDGSERWLYLLRPGKSMMTEAARDFFEFVLDYYEIEEYAGN